MSADQTIIAWKNDEEAVDNTSADMSASAEDDSIQYSGLEGDEADEVADELPQTVAHTGTLSNSRTLSIGSNEGAGAPGGGEENKKKTSLCSTLSSGDQPYLSLISSEAVSQRDLDGGC